MDEFWRLALLSLSMFIGCYVAGSIPLILSLSEGVLRRVTTFGAGLLIGTALIVIIPEGMESLFGSVISHEHDHHHESEAAEPVKMVVKNIINDVDLKNLPDEGVEMMLDKEQNSDYTFEQLQAMMGVSLVIGFIFMLLIDQCGGGHSHTHSPDVEGGTVGRHRRNRMTATIGLVVHAAADGLALGAAAGLSKTDVELIIFLAIMLHKAPAAFGFTSFLVHEGYDKGTAKKHLLAFALAAPVAAFLSYFGLVRVMFIVRLPITGIAMLFSAGTFLYVSTVHVLNEITQTPNHSATEHTGNTHASNNNSKLSNLELVLVVVGALLPLVFNAFHSHSH